MIYTIAGLLSYIMIRVAFGELLSPIQTGIIMAIVVIPLFIAVVIESESE